MGRLTNVSLAGSSSLSGKISQCLESPILWVTSYSLPTNHNIFDELCQHNGGLKLDEESIWHKCAFSCVETHARIFLVIRGTYNGPREVLEPLKAQRHSHPAYPAGVYPSGETVERA